jgi:formylmethanofuran dehydrogenase subunit E
MEDVLNKIDDPSMKEDIKKLIKFHGYLSSGALIGYQMLNIAKRELDIHDDEKIYVTCETLNCVPDPFQILRSSTIGNKGLKVLDYDKMAVTVNKGAGKDEKFVKGIRIYFDAKKTEKYPILHDWYMNYKKVRHEEVVPILLEAGEDVYSWEFVEIEVPEKKKKNVLLCVKCGESFVSWDKSTVCIPCSKDENNNTANK